MHKTYTEYRPKVKLMLYFLKTEGYFIYSIEAQMFLNTEWIYSTEAQTFLNIE